MLSQHLNASQTAVLVAVLDSLGSVASVKQFAECMDGIFQELLAHGCMVCGIGTIQANTIVPRQLLSNHFPQYYLSLIRQQNGALDSPVLEHWCKTRQAIFINLDESPGDWPESVLAYARRFNLGNLLSNGHADIGSAQTSYFSFHRITERLSDKHAALMRCITPHLHMALVRAFANDAAAAPPAKASTLLTARQQEALHWLSQGKSNWEIGMIMGTSEDTAKYHVSGLLSRLGAVNRVDVVVKAMQLKLLDRGVHD
jgi:DNA-binding CsgD family transcriptional regulator